MPQVPSVAGPTASPVIRHPRRPIAWPRTRPGAAASERRRTREAKPQRSDDSGERAAENRAQNGEATVLYGQNGARIRRIEVPTIDDVQRARTDESAEDDPQHQVADRLGWEPLAARFAEGEQYAHGDGGSNGEAIPRQRDRAEVDQRGTDVNSDHDRRALHHVARVTAARLVLAC
jgi:hypothetical protein